MSRFINELKRLSQAGNQPIGFKASPAALPKLKMTLLAALAGVGKLADDYAAGADAGLVSVSASSSAQVQKVCREMSNIPWGGWLQEGGEGAESAVEAGCDFIVFPPDTALAMLKKDVGRVLAVGASVGEGLLRAVNELPVDAVLIPAEPGEGYRLTWQHLMLFRRSADLLAKPLLAQAPPEVSADELQALWEAGVVGVVVAVDDRSRGRIAELRKVINGISFPAPGRKRKLTPLVPYIAEREEVAAEEEEEEE